MVDASTTEQLIVRLHRRLGFGLRSGELTGASAEPAEHAAALLDAPADDADAWGDEDYTVEPGADIGGRRRLGLLAIGRWIDHMAATDAPCADRLAWTWHGHFVSAFPEAKNPQFMVDQMRLFRSLGRRSFTALLRAVTVDPAMLLYLDGNDSTGTAPNENYSREVLELFTLGGGQYTEDDIAAGASALSGWRIARGSGTASFVARRHDDTPRTYLGTTGVHDVDTVVAAIAAHGAMPVFIARMLAREIVGPAVADDVVERCASAFVASDFDLDVLLRALVDELLAGADGGPIVTAPVPWYAAALRITGAAPTWREVLPHLQAAGQVPWLPPNVSGWPSGGAWTNASTLVGCCNIAALVAAATPDDAAVLSAVDARELAIAMCVPGGWSATTEAALATVTTRRERLAVALVAPEFTTS